MKKQMFSQIISLKSSRRLAARLALGVFAWVAATASLQGGTDTWIGNNSPNWGNTNNWSPLTAIGPVASDQLSFISAGTAGTALTNDFAAGTIFNGITFQSSSSAFTVAGNSIGLNGGITNSGTSAEVISNNLTLKGSETISASTGNITLAGIIDDGGNGYGLTKIGAGSGILSGANTFGGLVAVNAGTLRATTSGALPSTATVNFHAATNGSSVTLDLQGSSQTLANLNFTNLGTATIIITGTSGSALTVSPPTLLLSPNGVSNTLSLNMAGLSSFTYNNSSGTVTEEIGMSSPTGAAGTGSTTVTLAGGANSITATALKVGVNNPANSTPVSTLNLGTNNVLAVNTITLGSGRGGDTIQFASGITNGTLTITGAAGGGSLTTLAFAGHDSFQASDKPVDLFDVTAGTLTAQFGNVTIGQDNPTANMTGSRGVASTSSFKMGAGALTASSMTIGIISSAAGDTGSYTYNITNTSLFSITNGGTANITNLTVANNNYVGNLAANAKLSATVSLTNGAVLNATTIQEGTIASPSLGALNVTSQILWGDGTLGNIPGGNLTVNGVSVVLAGASTSHKFNITQGQSGSITANLSGAGTLTDIGAGALTLSGNNSFNGALIMAGANTLTLSGANTYTGSTTISNGTLLLSGSGSLSSPNIVVESNAVFDVSALAPFTLGASGGQTLAGFGGINGSVSANSGSQIVPGAAGVAGTLTFSNDLMLNGQTISFDLSPNLAAGNDLIAVGGTLTLNANATIWINPLAGSLAAGTYTLMTYAALVTNSFSFIPEAPRGTTLNVGANALTLVVTGNGGASLTWVGDGLMNNWDIETTTNWLNAGTLDFFYQLDAVTFDDTGSASPAINLAGALMPASVTVNATNNSYTFTGSGQLVGSMALTNNGPATLTLNTTNTYSGGTVINNGTVQLTLTNASASLPELAAGTGPITIMPNGVLSFTNNGGAPTHIIVTNPISGAGVISLPQNQEVSFNGPGSMSNFVGAINIPAGVTTTAKGDILAIAVNLSPGATINVANGGTLWAGAGGESVQATVNLLGNGNGEGWGALRVDSSATYSGPVNLLGNASVGAENGTSGTISGVISDAGQNYSLVKLGAATVIVTGANTYGGGTIVSNGTFQVGNGVNINGTLPGDVNIAGTNATLAFDVATNTTLIYNGAISGSGTVQENGFGGTLVVNGNNTFTNGVTISDGALWITNATALGAGSKVINLSNGTAGHPELHLNGINGNILLPTTLTLLTSWSGGAGSQGVLINEAGNNEIDGNFNLTSGGGGTAIVVNNGTLNLTGKLAPSTTLRTLQFGGAGNGAVSGVIADGASPNLLTSVTIAGPGAWTFAGTNTYVTNTIVSGGTLLVNGQMTGTAAVTVQTNATLGGSGIILNPVNLQAGGTLAPGTAALGTLSLSNNLSLSGNLSFKLNKSQAVSNDFVVVGGTLANSGTGTLTLTNLGPALVAGDSFQLFSKSVSGAGALTLQPAPGTGLAWSNTLASDGSVSVVAVSTVLIPTIPPAITNFSLMGGNVVISGTNSQAGGTYYLLTTTNLATPLNQWSTVATNVLGAASYTFIGTNVVGNSGHQFYRLSSTNYNPANPF